MKNLVRLILSTALISAFVVLLASCGSSHQAKTPVGYPTFADKVPLPELDPDEVVEIQLISLQENRIDDRGIEVAYRFASPKNRESVGSREDFGFMLREGPYRSMLSSRSFDIRLIEANRSIAYIAVRIEDNRGDFSGFFFILARQVGGQFDRCWMTEGVLRVRLPPDGSLSNLEPPNTASL